MNQTRNELSTSFDYDRDFLGRSDAFDLSPELPRSSGSVTVAGLPGAMADSAPDRWGRNLIEKATQSRNQELGLPRRMISEIDFLLGVSDLTRQGAIRYCIEDEHSLSSDNDVPKLLELPRLLNAADIVSREFAGTEEMAAIKILLAAGTGSLGGARPKASVRNDGRLSVAKFPHHADRWNVMAWEMTALDLAEICGIRTPKRRLVDVDGRQVLLLDRFDRETSNRIPYISAMTLVNAQDGDHRDYVEIAEALQDVGSAVTKDLHEMWRRIAFSVAINNTDDHLRNHGFLYRDGGWRLSPVFDVNPCPELGSERSTSINFSTKREQSLNELMKIADYFDLESSAAEETWDEVLAGVAKWRDVASSHGISSQELRLFSDALDTFALRS